MTDSELFSAYLATRSADAFRQLVDRYLPLVYASALRQLRDPHLAEDAAQAVFLVFIKKAATLRIGTILSAWLLTTTRYVCKDARKLAHRRQLHEQKAAAMNQSTSQPPATDATDYSAITPHLDDALATLTESDRAAVILRFFDAQPLKEIGAALHISESTAQKRLERAVQKLRAFFAGHNITLSAATLPIALAAHAPVSVAPALFSTVAAVHAPAAVGHSVAALAHSALRALFWTPAKIAAAAAAALVPLISIAIVAVTIPTGDAASPGASAPPLRPIATSATAAVASQAVAASSEPANTYHLPKELLIFTVERIMGEPGGMGDPLPAIKASILAMANGHVEDTFPQLADAILNAKPTAFREAVMDHATIDVRSTSPWGPFAWDYGTFQDRDKLRQQLWTAASVEFGADPVKAKRYARAAFLFRAMDDFPSGGYGLVALFRSPSGMSITGLDPEKISELESARVDYSHTFSNMEDGNKAKKQIDRLFKHPTADEFDLTIKALDQWLAAGLTDADQFGFAGAVVQLSNHAAATGNQEIIRRVKDQEQTWLKPAQDHFKTWLTQAINEPSTEPTRMFGRAEMLPDGREIDTDSDDNFPPETP